ncbi:MAG: hypothetical protein AB8I08_30825 [Sandaracinaceae bacterium]
MRYAFSSLAVVVLVQASAAQAQDARLERARVAFERGQAAFSAEDYVGARQGFQEAYDLTENPAIRYNLGLVEERVGHFEAAAEHFRFYVARASTEEDLAAARQHLDAVERQLERDDTEPSEGVSADVDPVAVEAPDPSPEPASSSTSLGWGVFAGTLGVGVAVSAGLAIAAGVIWGDATTTYDERLNDCAPDCDDQVVADLDASVTASNALWITAVSVGVLSAALATVLLVSTGSSGESVAVRVSPTSVITEGRF